MSSVCAKTQPPVLSTCTCAFLHQFFSSVYFQDSDSPPAPRCPGCESSTAKHRQQSISNYYHRKSTQRTTLHTAGPIISFSQIPVTLNYILARTKTQLLSQHVSKITIKYKNWQTTKEHCGRQIEGSET